MRARLCHPWRKEDYLRSLAWLAVGLVLLAAAWRFRLSDALGLPAQIWLGMPAAVIVMMAMRRLKRGRARSHGKEVESQPWTICRRYFPRAGHSAAA